jgi:hypothetical protein
MPGPKFITNLASPPSQYTAKYREVVRGTNRSSQADRSPDGSFSVSWGDRDGSRLVIVAASGDRQSWRSPDMFGMQLPSGRASEHIVLSKGEMLSRNVAGNGIAATGDRDRPGGRPPLDPARANVMFSGRSFEEWYQQNGQYNELLRTLTATTDAGRVTAQFSPDPQARLEHLMASAPKGIVLNEVKVLSLKQVGDGTLPSRLEITRYDRSGVRQSISEFTLLEARAVADPNELRLPWTESDTLYDRKVNKAYTFRQGTFVENPRVTAMMRMSERSAESIDIWPVVGLVALVILCTAYIAIQVRKRIRPATR